MIRLLVLLLSLGLMSQSFGQAIPPGVEKHLKKMAQEMEVPTAKNPPPWFDPKAEPLFRFALLADIHLTPGREKLLHAAMTYINDKVRPAFVGILGDNSGRSSVKAQTHLKELLDKGFSAPYYIIRGDNWARNFSRVFGTTRFAFECGGVCFVFAGLDRDTEGKGVGVFVDETWRWFEKELRPPKKTSVLFFLHENIQPPIFLDARRLDVFLEKSPSVAATFTGHLHYDLEFKLGRVRHLILPGFGPHRLHGFKVCEVFPRHVAVRSVEWKGGHYVMVEKYQKIDLLHPARKPAAKPIENYRSLPARETDFTFDAKKNHATLLLLLMDFARRLGRLDELMEMMGKRKGKKAKKDEGEDF
jgi:hypothetical protein